MAGTSLGTARPVGIPFAYGSAAAEFGGRETAVCRCGGSLHFDTDHEFGYTIESCDRCKVSRPMQRAPRREELDPMPTEAKVVAIVPPCADCGVKLEWAGVGSMPNRCKECKSEHRRRQHREWRKRRAA